MANDLNALGPNEQQCLELIGVPSGPGVYEVEVTGELTISLFGAPYSIGDYTFAQTLIVLPSSGGTPGCAYPFATNYNPSATVDDGSCYIAACTDEEACNYLHLPRWTTARAVTIARWSSQVHVGSIPTEMGSLVQETFLDFLTASWRFVSVRMRAA